ncbi:hypothetical protein [Phenylobacterium kunshanense]|uniref:Uncharacterized protein n=1 Tax=Phenylobacterium kunshanense TaxID=1445034 RepID=A0A328B5U5_9CAUL|nr:hypothetical protein [Phenylobacterium kunshanense]RAK61955.1 hypothetical protein DJ019_20480 [Phenylobacterium kunshanense]
MTPLAIALALFAQDAAPAAEAAPAPPPVEDRLPTGAPKEDYPFVAWCYGALRGYLDLHDEVMPEVKRIEGQFRKPGTSLEDDLRVYAEMQADGRAKLKQFQSALTAAERASPRPINMIGAQAVRQGRSAWLTGPEVTKARKAQEWMSWALPARCEKVAAQLETRSVLMGTALKANAPADAPPSATDEPPAAEAPPSPAPETAPDAPAVSDPLSDPTS